MTRASTPARSSSDSGIDATRATARATMSSRSGEPAAGTTGASAGDLAQAAAQASGVDDVTRAPAALRTTFPPIVILGVAGSSPVSHPCFSRASRPDLLPGAGLASTTTQSPRPGVGSLDPFPRVVSGSSRDGPRMDHPGRQHCPRRPSSGADPGGAHEPVDGVQRSVSAAQRLVEGHLHQRR